MRQSFDNVRFLRETCAQMRECLRAPDLPDAVRSELRQLAKEISREAATLDAQRRERPTQERRRKAS